MDNKKEVIKHSAAIQISNEVNLLQRRAWNVLLANAFDDLEKNDEYHIPVKDLCKVLGYDSRNDKYLKQLLRGLMDVKVEWNIFGKDGREWGAAVLLAQVQIINGIMTYGYAPILRKRLHNPTMYARISLSLQNQFSSKHSLALYELFVDYYNIKAGYGETPAISIEDFRRFHGLKDDEYREFKDLNKFVIKKAVGEVNQKSDLLVDVEYKREGRKVVALKFRIKKNPKNENIIDIGEIERKLEKNQKQLSIPESRIENQDLFDVLVNEFGISNGKAMDILKSKDEFFIEEVLDSVRIQIKAGRVMNVPAFTVKALENDYRAKKSKYEIEAADVKKQKQKVDQNEKLLRKLQGEFERERREKAENVFKSLSESMKESVVEEFGKEIDVTGNKFTKKAFRTNGVASAVVKPFFRCFVADRFLPEEDREFEAWAQKKGYKVKSMKNGKYEILPL